MKFIFILLTLVFVSCNWAKQQKTKETVNKTGEVIAKTGSEFVDGVTKGVEKTFQNEVRFSDQLTAKGLKAGKIIVQSSDSATDNILTAYLIFDNDFNQHVTVKALTETGLEYGRVMQTITGLKGEARYIDFVFDKRTNIDRKGTITFE